MRKFYIVGFLVLLMFDTITQVSFKYAAVNAGEASIQVAWLVRLLHQPWLYAALLSYFGAFITYMTLLRHAPVGPAFAATQLAVVTVLIYSVVFLGEHMSAWQIAGAVLILGGISLLGEEPEKAVAVPPSIPETSDVA